MKTNIVINIGLIDTSGNPVELHRAIHEIERAGITLLASGVVTGEWEGKPEQTLVLCGLAFPSPELKPRLYSATRALSQHCIAVWQDGKGELIGEDTSWKFDPELFHFHPRESQDADFRLGESGRFYDEKNGSVVSPLSECEAVQAKHRAKAEEIDGWECSAQFTAYLEGTLIPDLKESGLEATAQDFETAVKFIRAK